MHTISRVCFQTMTYECGLIDWLSMVLRLRQHNIGYTCGNSASIWLVDWRKVLLLLPTLSLLRRMTDWVWQL